jgi:ketosteroid isomerase-like protein
VTVVNRMTEAAVSGNHEALAACFTPDVAFHVLGPLPKAGDHTGVDGFLAVIGSIMELTGGDVKLEQLFALGEGEWAAEWEHAVLGRNGTTLEMNNAFIYRFEGGRIAELWMLCAAPAGSGSFFA